MYKKANSEILDIKDDSKVINKYYMVVILLKIEPIRPSWKEAEKNILNVMRNIDRMLTNDAYQEKINQTHLGLDYYSHSTTTKEERGLLVSNQFQPLCDFSILHFLLEIGVVFLKEKITKALCM